MLNLLFIPNNFCTFSVYLGSYNLPKTTEILPKRSIHAALVARTFLTIQRVW